MNLEERFKQTDIYPVITPEFCAGRPPVEVLEAVLRGGAKIVQLRDKKSPEKYAADFREITNKYNALLIINDFIDIAIKHDADGIHIGQEDISIIEARTSLPDKIIGVSINTGEEALFAQENGASYVNIGVIFPTKTKNNVKSVTGLGLIRQISPHLKIPYTVIGGINQSNIKEVLEAGARHIAIASAITEAEDVESSAKSFIEIFKSFSPRL